MAKIIFIESEQKKAISENKPLKETKFLRKEGELEIYLFPSRKFIIGHEKVPKKKNLNAYKFPNKLIEKI